MKKIMCLAAVLAASSAYAETQQERDQKLIQDLERRHGLDTPAPAAERLTSSRLLNGSSDVESDASSQIDQTRIVKVLLDEYQSADDIANELDIELISDGDDAAAVYRVGENQSISSVVGELKQHPGVLDAKQETIIRVNKPQ
ncbi:hypothetical protein [Agaribacterium haliotis]|uniref:hypothetical protein n=1 Tax=Agaribacterium haliotis TaxID=2013869 RepID=UPI000BB53DEE|nr:hypothetical protein [Agaribacterium haliotis]